jgi:hypothetical protein
LYVGTGDKGGVEIVDTDEGDDVIDKVDAVVVAPGEEQRFGEKELSGNEGELSKGLLLLLSLL